ncbi:MAG: type II toxin-antitoxin system Phd/YefM family antitoxin [Deltaproteobacteria bacterium]|nr:type II toxin-antitoxin system Phd/YefM family antitoxin [Deltaproteobacteria bacterium]MBW2633936.1 type II toxin-antitoxin system Phd/YefM family antitoxin [Deltaproteobacteria bacterium]
MKPITISKNIISLSDFKSRASKMLNEVQKSHRPIVITQNGKAAAVLIAPADFDLLTERARFVNAVETGMVDIKEGRVLADEELGSDL